MNTINETTATTTKCTVIYQDEQARASGGYVQSRHNSPGAALRFIDKVLAVRHAGPFRIVAGHRSASPKAAPSLVGVWRPSESDTPPKESPMSDALTPDLAALGYEQHRGCLVLLTLDGATVHHGGSHIADFREPRIGAVAPACEYPLSYAGIGLAVAAVESALTERYAATLDPAWLSSRVRTAAGLD